MSRLMNYPLLIGVVTLVCLWAFALLGAFLRKRKATGDDTQKDEYGIVLSATLTLLGLLIGFSFSMAIAVTINAKTTRQRKPTRSEPNTFALIFCPILFAPD